MLKKIFKNNLWDLPKMSTFVTVQHSSIVHVKPKTETDICSKTFKHANMGIDQKIVKQLKHTKAYKENRISLHA